MTQEFNDMMKSPGLVGHANHKPVQHRDGKPPWCKVCGLDANYQKPEAIFMNASNDPHDFQQQAKIAVITYYNDTHDIREAIGTESVYVVWFAKTLANWKALLSTTIVDCMYYEVTHNGANGETYLDAYEMKANVKFTGFADLI